MTTLTQTLEALGLELPPLAAPVAAYIPATIDRGVVRTSGQIPLVDGQLVATGAVGPNGTDPAVATKAARVAALNALAAAADAAGSADSLVRVIKVTGFVSSTPDFTGQAAVLNGASELYGQLFPGGHIRSAVGVAALPLDAPVEVEAEFELAEPPSSLSSPTTPGARVSESDTPAADAGVDLPALVAHHLDAARADENGRSARRVVRDDVLRQTVVALRAGTRLAEHNSPPAASLQVLSGRVRLEAGGRTQGEFGAGELWTLTHERHSVLALEDSAFLLTTVTSVGPGSHG